MWDIAKAVLRGKFIAWTAFVRKKDLKSIISASTLEETVEKEEQIESKVHRRKELMKIRVELSENENRKLIQKSQQNQNLILREGE